MLIINKLKLSVLLFGVLLPCALSGINGKVYIKHSEPILIQKAQVQGTPKDSFIQATIDGHCLTVVFTENLGQVVVEVTTDGGVEVDASALYTPNGVIFYIPETGSYIVTFTLPNGDVYYGEFEVTD